jgi:ATP-dependent RNA helicase SUPV3L1/SUV3
MLSILGATPDDMEEILKGLGYRADSVSAEEAAAFLAAHKTSATETAEAAKPETDSVDDADQPAADGEQEAAVSEPVTETPVQDEAAVAAEPAEIAEAKPVLLWRPGGRNENQRPAGRPAGDRRGANQGQRTPGGERQQAGEPNGDKRRDDRRPEGRRDQPDGGRGKFAGKGDRQDRGDRKDRGPRPDRDNNKSQPARFEAKPPRKEKPVDPDSPFAKLAALKEQMKK